MNELHELAYRIDPALWGRKMLGMDPAPWEQQFLRAPLGASISAPSTRRGGSAFSRSDRCLAADAGAAPGSAVRHPFDGVEPHRSLLDSLGKRRPESAAPQSHGRNCRTVLGRILGAGALRARRTWFQPRISRDSDRRKRQSVPMGIV